MKVCKKLMYEANVCQPLRTHYFAAAGSGDAVLVFDRE